MQPLEDNKVYLEKWYDVCTDLCKSMSWNPQDLPAAADDTFINSWRRAEIVLNKDEYNFSTHTIFERVTGTKPDTSSADGRTHFNTFSTAYNAFCADNNFPAHEGFPESQDGFFKYVLARSPQVPAPPPGPKAGIPAPATSKLVHFTSAPPIATLPPISPSPEDFPVLRAPSKEPISYASATASFIPVTRRHSGKITAAPATTTSPTNPSKPTPKSSGPPPAAAGPKSLRPTKPPLLDALKTTKHTIILNHTHPDTKALYALDAGELI